VPGSGWGAVGVRCPLVSVKPAAGARYADGRVRGRVGRSIPSGTGHARNSGRPRRRGPRLLRRAGPAAPHASWEGGTVWRRFRWGKGLASGRRSPGRSGPAHPCRTARPVSSTVCHVGRGARFHAEAGPEEEMACAGVAGPAGTPGPRRNCQADGTRSPPSAAPARTSFRTFPVRDPRADTEGRAGTACSVSSGVRADPGPSRNSG